MLVFTGLAKVSALVIVKKVVNKFGSLVNNPVVCTVQSKQSNLITRIMKTNSNIKVTAFSKINNLVLEGLKKDGLKWFMPWKNEDGSLYSPINHVTGRAYNGINRQLLSAVARDKGYTSNEWGTFKNISEVGGAIRKGEKATAVTLWVLSYEIKETGKYITQAEARKKFKLPTDVINGTLRESWGLRYYLVFNIEQADNVTPKRVIVEPTAVEPIPTAEDIYNSFPNKPTLGHGGNSAHYVPTRDHVQMPEMNQFFDVDSYYKTLFHELVHSTGHAKRLNRKSLTDIKRSGDDLYSKEELVAEIGAWYLTGLCNLDPKDSMLNSQAYINGWSKKLAEQEKEVVYAMSQANKAVELIIGKGGDKTPSKPKKSTKETVLASNQVFINHSEVAKATGEEDLRKHLKKSFNTDMVCEMTFSSPQEAQNWKVYEVLNIGGNEGNDYNIYITEFAGEKAIGYALINKLNSKQVTIYEIADNTARTSNYFDAESLRFFNQKLEHFDVEPIGNGEYICYAPSTWDGRLMGYSCIIYDSESHKLKSLNLTDEEKSSLDGVQEVIEVLKLEREEKVVYSKQVTIDEWSKEIVQLSISEKLGDIAKWFELATDRRINFDSEDWAILEKKILKCLIKNSK